MAAASTQSADGSSASNGHTGACPGRRGLRISGQVVGYPKSPTPRPSPSPPTAQRRWAGAGGGWTAAPAPAPRGGVPSLPAQRAARVHIGLNLKARCLLTRVRYALSIILKAEPSSEMHAQPAVVRLAARRRNDSASAGAAPDAPARYCRGPALTCPSSPPPTVTSGRRKAMSAARAASPHASTRFPWWSSTCRSTLRCHTLRPAGGAGGQAGSGTPWVTDRRPWRKCCALHALQRTLQCRGARSLAL